MKRMYLIMVMIAAMMMSCNPEAEKATVKTSDVTDVTSNSAKVVCNVSDDGGAEVSSRGVCWDTSGHPTIETASSIGAGSGIGNYECEIDGLKSNTTYYVRAYATNSAGISYGGVKNFTTLDADGGNDGDGNDGGGNGGNGNNGGGNYAGHGYVDLGLPSGLKWATCNVGANKPEEYGNYYAWGETTTKSDYSSSNSLTSGLSKSELQSQGYIDGSGNLTSQHDAATANWGGSWRMPTEEECRELVNNCTWQWTTQNDVTGYRVTGPNGNSIFLPAAGYRYGSSLNLAGDNGYYWSSTPDDYDLGNNAYYLDFSNGDEDLDDSGRYYGQTVRPISE